MTEETPVRRGRKTEGSRPVTEFTPELVKRLQRYVGVRETGEWHGWQPKDKGACPGDALKVDDTQDRLNYELRVRLNNRLGKQDVVEHPVTNPPVRKVPVEDNKVKELDARYLADPSLVTYLHLWLGLPTNVNGTLTSDVPLALDTKLKSLEEIK